MFMGQIIESNNLQDLQGQSVTVSFWARAGANYSATGSTLYATIRTGTVADQGLNILISPGWTGATTQSQTVTLTTSWQYFTKTYTIPTTAQELSAFFEAYPTGTAGANDFFDITGFQLEKGSTATSFDYRPYGTELALCQRYYQRNTADSAYTAFASGDVSLATGVSVYIKYTTQMRSSPVLNYGGSVAVYSGGGFYPITSVNNLSAGRESALWQPTVSGGGMTTGRGCTVTANNSSSAYIELSSEL
jgi:hypothetical protein